MQHNDNLFNIHDIERHIIVCLRDIICKTLIQDHRKTDHEKRERRGAISQSDAHISMLSRVNKKTDRYPERVKNNIG